MIYDIQNAPVEGTNNDERGKSVRAYNRKNTENLLHDGCVTFKVQGAVHSFDLKRIYEFCHTPNGTLSFRTVGTPQRHFTGELAAKLYAALLQWNDHYTGGAI
jgi:hypothetical protein